VFIRFFLMDWGGGGFNVGDFCGFGLAGRMIGVFRLNFYVDRV
jgi:hypothetical protein